MNTDTYNRLCEAVERLQVETPQNWLIVTPRQLVAIIANIQLALSHPGNKGIWADEAASIAQVAIDNIGKVDPELGKILQRGFTHMGNLLSPV